MFATNTVATDVWKRFIKPPLMKGCEIKAFPVNAGGVGKVNGDSDDRKADCQNAEE
jgi:hypothetical protein